LTQSQATKKLHDFLKSIEKEYDECLEQTQCKEKMTKAMKDNLVSIKAFVQKLKQKDSED
jgi:hypothetical protein